MSSEPSAVQVQMDDAYRCIRLNCSLTCDGGEGAALLHECAVDEPGAVAQGIRLLHCVTCQAISDYDQQIDDGSNGQQRYENEYPDPKFEGRQQTRSPRRLSRTSHHHNPFALIQRRCGIEHKAALLRQRGYKGGS